jgi:hypothetical protein
VPGSKPSDVARPVAAMPDWARIERIAISSSTRSTSAVASFRERSAAS